jgi:hypothetical protein
LKPDRGWRRRFEDPILLPRGRQIITLAEMRAAGVSRVLVYCSDYRCSHWTRIDADQRAHGVQLSDFEPGFVYTACP